MNKEGLTSRIAEILKNNDVKKSVSISSHQFFIMDEEGNQSTFRVPIPIRKVQYTKTDISNILDAFFAVLEDCIKRGEELSIYGVVSFGIKQRAARMTKIPGTEDWVNIPEKYVPYTKFGNILKTAARIYEANLKESQVELPPPIYDSFDDEEDDI